jgi:peptidyl-prolyl cis-trans isomerase D
VFELPDRYLVALLSKSTEEGPATVEDVREALTTNLKKQKKADLLIQKLGKGTIEQLQNKKVEGTVVNTANDITFTSTAIGDIGYDPEAVGHAFGLKEGKTSEVMRGEAGVYVLKVLKYTPATLDPKADLSAYKQQITSRTAGRAQYYIGEALKEVGKVKDQRVRFF